MTLWFAALLAFAAPVQDPVVTAGSIQESDGTHTLVHSVAVDATSSAVWNAISTPQGWQRWAAPVARGVAGAPDLLETSYDPASQPGDASTIRQQFLARIPNRLLVFRTVKAPEGFPDFAVYARVTTIIELEAMDAAHTRIRITATGFDDSEAGRRLLGFFREGNRVTLEKLRDLFARD